MAADTTPWVADRVRPKPLCGGHKPTTARLFRPRWAQRHPAPTVSPPLPHSLSTFCSASPKRSSELAVPSHRSTIAAHRRHSFTHQLVSATPAPSPLPPRRPLASPYCAWVRPHFVFHRRVTSPEHRRTLGSPWLHLSTTPLLFPSLVQHRTKS